MRKRVKIKKQVYYVLIVIILLFVGIKFALHKYEEYKYHQTYEYKLLEHGYKENEVETILNNFNQDEDLNYFLNNKVNQKYIDLLNEKYYLSKNFYNYIAYMDKHKKLNINEVIRNININLDKDFYSTDYKTDTSLDTLMLVNKYYLLNKDYVPEGLVSISQKYAWGDKGAHKVRDFVYEAFINMWDAAYQDGLYLMVNSSYRSYEEQEAIYDRRKKLYGTKKADSQAARPGASEHQTGLTLDIFSKTNSNRNEFNDSEEAKWLLANSYKYGFIQRYPSDKINITGYDFEAWHFRYVGIEAATVIHDNDLTFEEYYAYYIEK